MIIPVDQFTRQLAESGLIAPDKLPAILDGLPAQQKSDSQSLARELVRQNILTAYQAQELFNGRGSQLVLGDYVVLDKLGQGGMGMVLKAMHRRMERIVAIKVLSPNVTKTPAMLARFQREVKAAAKLSHQNIVIAHDAGEAAGTHFLVMEFVDGTDLSALVKRDGPLPLERALSCVLQAARGLEYAHGRGVVHRDIKPANLLLDRDGTVKILDMGLARLDDAGESPDELTGTGQIMGTVDYMAPEQALSTKSADRRADIYSLGITLWYLLTGRPAYTGDSTMARLVAHRERPIPSIRDACPAAPHALDAVFARMVAKTPEARYQTITEAIADLERCRTGRDVSAPALSSAPGEDSRLNEFLRNLDQSAASRGVTGKPLKASAAPAIAPTRVEESLANTLPLGDTDPTTELLIGTSSVVLPRPAWLAKLPFAPTRRNLALASAAAVLLVASIVGIWWSTRPTVRVADGDLLAPASGRVSGDGASASQASGGRKPPGNAATVNYQWPADAPAPAIAPFDAAQARKYQEEWAAHLGVPVEYENSIGMKFVLIPPGEFQMGSTAAEIEAALVVAGSDETWKNFIRSEAPRHTVILTQPIYLGVHEVTQAQYEQVMRTNPSHFAATGAGKDAVANLGTSTHPVELVSWNDAAEFCTKLSEREELKPFYFRSGETITPLDGTGYRLPTEAEWEFACRAGTMTRFWSGDTDQDLFSAGWFNANSGGRPHRVEELKANPFGLYDIHGNVWEWVQDGWEPAYYGQFVEKPALDPSGPSSAGSRRVLRGGHWGCTASHCRSSDRYASGPTPRYYYVGIRVVLSVNAVRSRLQRAEAAAVWANTLAADAPAPAIAPFDATQAKKHQQEWAEYLKLPVEYENTIGMKFVLIPPGEFTMGSTAEEIEAALVVAGNNEHWKNCIRSEAPRHKVILIQAIYLGIHEVTQSQYEQVMGQNPSDFAATGAGKDAVVGLDTNTHPVETVSWNDAVEFCAKLSEQEQLKPYYFRGGETVTMLKGNGYRLPTEAQWEFACRAGTTTRFWSGDGDESLVQAGWLYSNAGGRTHAVGELKANSFGLYDIHGNVWEWVQDWWEPTYYGQFQETVGLDPSGPSSAGSFRVFRGGGWDHVAVFCRSALRLTFDPTHRTGSSGFRLALSVDAVKALRSTQSAAMPVSAETLFSSGGTWAEPENLGPVLNGPDDERYPRLSVDGLTLYFTSTRAGGLGETDIYQTRRASLAAAWQPPENLGAVINSAADDAGPWLSADGLTLWFASKRGDGWNIYRSIRSAPDAPWPQAELVDAPISSPGGDGGPALTADGLTLVFHSSRAQKGGSDIWFASRGDVNASFGEPTCPEGPVNTAAQESDPWLSTDGRLLLFDRGTRSSGLVRDRSLWWAYRSASDGPFESCRPIDGVELASADQCTPALSPDGNLLLFSSNRPGGHGATDLWMSRWKPAASEQASTAGWHGWPADAPAAAIAPFDADQARKHQEEWAAHLGVPVEYENSIGMKFALIPPGEFMMGSTPEEIEAALVVAGGDDVWKQRIRSEVPRHKVVLTQPMYLGVHEVTQTQYEQVIGTNPSHFAPMGTGKDSVPDLDTTSHPVERISWNDAAEYCAKLSEQEKLKPYDFRSGGTVAPLEGTGYRLPTEAEWEFACRAGPTTQFWSGEADEDLIQVGWFGRNSGERTHSVGELKANPFGLFDIHGNVWEWVQDWWEADYYVQFQERPALDPRGPSSAGSRRVVRGGSWGNVASYCRASYRDAYDPTTRYLYIGFRVALSVDAVRSARRPRNAESTPDDESLSAYHVLTSPDWEWTKPENAGPNVNGPSFEAQPGLSADGLMLFFQSAPLENPTAAADLWSSRRKTTKDPWERRIGLRPDFNTPSHEGAPCLSADGLELLFVVGKNNDDSLRIWHATRAAIDGPWMAPVPLPDEINSQVAAAPCLSADGNTFLFASDRPGGKGDWDIWMSQRSSRDDPWSAAANLGPAVNSPQEDIPDWISPDGRVLVLTSKRAGALGSSDIWLCTRRSADEEWSEPVNFGAPLNTPEGEGHATLSADGRTLMYYSRRADGLGNADLWQTRRVRKQKKMSLNKDAPPPAIAPFDAAQARKHQEEWAEYLGVPVEYENTIGMKFRLIPAGEFMMGSTPEEIETALAAAGEDEFWKSCIRTEAPRHNVVLTSPFYLGINEVTQTQYEGVMGTNPSYFAASGAGKEAVGGMDTSMHPVEMASWNEAADFCAKLSEIEDHTPCYLRSGETVTRLHGNGYRLPTEAQWEFACRSGSTTRFWSGDEDADLVQVGCFNGDSGGRTHPVAERKANPLGLFDIHGNIWEWCADYYGTYPAGASIDPIGPDSGDFRVIRGGSWRDNAGVCRSANRSHSAALPGNEIIGFRVALSVDAVKAARDRSPNSP